MWCVLGFEGKMGHLLRGWEQGNAVHGVVAACHTELHVNCKAVKGDVHLLPDSQQHQLPFIQRL